MGTREVIGSGPSDLGFDIHADIDDSHSSPAPDLRGDPMAPVREVAIDPSAVLDFSVRSDAIQGREGNFLFTVGSTGSGKSTLQHFLVYWLHCDRTLNLDYASTEEAHVHDAHLNQWIQEFARGYLPERTPQGTLQEFRIGFSQKGRPRLDFSFVEISGEDIRSILPNPSDPMPRLHAQLEQYLRLQGANRRFVFVSDATANRRDGTGRVFYEDILFSTLIRYLLSERGVNLKKLNILFVASKWDAVKSDYRSVQAYFNTHFTQTRALVDGSSRIRASFIPFSVGDIVLAEEGGETVARVRAVDNTYIRYLVSWVYHSFKGTHLRGGYPRVARSLMGRLMDFARLGF